MTKELPEDPSFVKEIDDALDKFENDLAGMPKWSKIDAPAYLYMSVSELVKKTPDELSEAVFTLNQYSLNIQRLINKLRSWERWCNGQLDSLEAHYILDISPTYGYNERPKIARYNPEICKKINEYLRKLRMQIDRLYDVPNQVKIMADCIRDLKFIAIKREKNYNNAD